MVGCGFTGIIIAEVFMKNSKEYGKKIKKLYLSLRRKSAKIAKPVYDDPVEAMVYAIISEGVSESRTKTALKRFGDNFVDLNDLRVSLALEVTEMLSEDSPATRKIASNLSKTLAYVFSNYHCVSLEPLKKLGKRPARAALEKIEAISRFVVDYCVLTSLGGHAIPLTPKMIEYLKDNELVDADANENDIEGFLSRQISAANAYEFYAMLRHESETAKAKKKAIAGTKRKPEKTRTAERKTVKKNVKKKTVKKKTRKTKKD